MIIRGGRAKLPRGRGAVRQHGPGQAGTGEPDSESDLKEDAAACRRQRVTVPPPPAAVLRRCLAFMGSSRWAPAPARHRDRAVPGIPASPADLRRQAP